MDHLPQETEKASKGPKADEKAILVGQQRGTRIVAKRARGCGHSMCHPPGLCRNQSFGYSARTVGGPRCGLPAGARSLPQVAESLSRPAILLDMRHLRGRKRGLRQ